LDSAFLLREYHKNRQKATPHDAYPRAALEAEFEKQYDNRKAPGTNSFPELLYYF
jgi:hypothetical protein